jgi:hypothetical protein
VDIRGGGGLQKVAEDGGEEGGGWGSRGGGASTCHFVPAEGGVGEEPSIHSAQECRGEVAAEGVGKGKLARAAE